MDAIMNLAALCLAAFFAAASVTAGIASVCRILKWAPVNLTINSNVYRDPPSDSE